MGFTDEEQDNNNYSTEEYIMIDVEYVDEYQLISDKQIIYIDWNDYCSYNYYFSSL